VCWKEIGFSYGTIYANVIDKVELDADNVDRLQKMDLMFTLDYDVY